MQPSEFSKITGPAIEHLGGAFMTADATNARGEELGLDFASFYGLGRASVLGDASPEVIASAYPFIASELVIAIWSGAVEKLSPADAVEPYAEACRDWGRQNLAGSQGLDRLSELLQPIIDSAPAHWGWLFAGWRAVPRPDDSPGRTAQLLHVARELRGAMHVSALLNSALSPTEAVMVSGGAEAMAQYLWPEPYPDPEPLRAEHAALLARTDELFGRVSEAITAPERAELAGLLAAAVADVDAAKEPSR